MGDEAGASKSRAELLAEQRERGGAIKDELKAEGLLLAEVAAEMGLDPSNFSRYLSGWSLWPADFPVRLSRAIDTVRARKGVAA